MQICCAKQKFTERDVHVLYLSQPVIFTIKPPIKACKIQIVLIVLQSTGCGIHYQTRQLVAQTWMLSSLVPNHSSIVNILCCFYLKKKSKKKSKMFISKCIYVIQIFVSLACLLKSLQHIEVQKYPVDVDVEFNG